MDEQQKKTLKFEDLIELKNKMDLMSIPNPEPLRPEDIAILKKERIELFKSYFEQNYICIFDNIRNCYPSIVQIEYIYCDISSTKDSGTLIRTFKVPRVAPKFPDYLKRSMNAIKSRVK